MTERRIRTKFEPLVNGFRVVREVMSEGGWEHEHSLKFWCDVPGLILAEADGIVPLGHEQAETLTKLIGELVAHSANALKTMSDAQFICPDCKHKSTEDYVPEGHPCTDCGEPGWKHFEKRDDG